MKCKKPNKKQARVIMEVELDKKIKETSAILDRQVLAMRKLKTGLYDNDIEVGESDVSTDEWYINLCNMDVNIYEFVKKYKIEEKEVSRF